MLDLLSNVNGGLYESHNGQVATAIPIAANRVCDRIVAPRAHRNEIVFDGLIRNEGVAAGAMVDLQPVARAVFVTESATMTVQSESSGTLGGPEIGGDVLLVGHGSFASPSTQNPAYLTQSQLAEGRSRLARYAGSYVRQNENDLRTLSTVIITRCRPNVKCILTQISTHAQARATSQCQRNSVATAPSTSRRLRSI